MKKFLFLAVIFGAASFFTFTPSVSAKYKDCWGNWRQGMPGDHTCYSVSSVQPDRSYAIIDYWRAPKKPSYWLFRP